MNMNDLTINVENAITAAAGQFVNTIAQYKWELIPDTQLHAAKQALMKSDYIMKIAAGNPSAVHDALIKSAILGLDLTEGKRQGWLLPRKNQQGKTVIQLQVGYKGVEAIHQRMGVIDRLVIRVVYEKDTFDWSGDDQEKPKHEADWFSKDRGAISGVFAITYYPDGTINVATAPVTEIFEKHRDISDSWKNYQTKTKKGEYAFPPPWASHEKAMIEKTMAYIAAKQWPANIRDEGSSSKILETLHQVDAEDYTFGYTQQQKEAFYEFIENKDSLGIYLFTKRVGIEVYLALHKGLANGFPKGKKMKLKKEHSDFVEMGCSQFFDITKALDENDSGLLHENIEDCSEITLKLLESFFSDGQKTAFKEMTDAA
jgi:phage RecT family recombinase